MQALLQETEKLLNTWKHPDPYCHPTAPGGTYKLLRYDDTARAGLWLINIVHRIQIREKSSGYSSGPCVTLLLFSPATDISTNL